MFRIGKQFKYIIYVKYNRHNFFKKFSLFFPAFRKQNSTELKNPVLNFPALLNTNVELNISTSHFARPGMLFSFFNFIYTNLTSLKKFINTINWYGTN
jgi:hypothetical protein